MTDKVDKKKELMRISVKLEECRKIKKKVEEEHEDIRSSYYSYESELDDIEEEIDELEERRREIYMEERNRLEGLIDRLDEKHRSGLDDVKYRGYSKDINKRIKKINSVLGSIDGASGVFSDDFFVYKGEYRSLARKVRAGDRPLFSPELKAVLCILGSFALIWIALNISILLLVLSVLIAFAPSLGVAVLITLPVALMIGLIIRSVILRVSAKMITGEEVSHHNCLTAIVASMVTTIGSSVILYMFLPITLSFLESTANYYMSILLKLILNIALIVWIYRSVFNTTWPKAFSIFLIETIITVGISVLLYVFLTQLFT